MEISNAPKPEKPTYEKDFARSVDLFEKSFKEFQSSSFSAQKQAYIDVMKESLVTMQESANAMVNTKLNELKETLKKDLDKYLEDPNNENKNKVSKDILNIKNNE
ncbi:MAG: hypothetical protein EBZ47_02250 [Chlamydiae bacterium]|nr:hypothetical protein [Chlamydiota bacterium]